MSHYYNFIGDRQPSTNFWDTLNHSIRIMYSYPKVDKIIYNLKGRTTIVYFKDGDKVIVKCSKYERFDKETGLAMAFMKKMFKNRNEFKRLVASGKIQE